MVREKWEVRLGLVEERLDRVERLLGVTAPPAEPSPDVQTLAPMVEEAIPLAAVVSPPPLPVAALPPAPEPPAVEPIAIADAPVIETSAVEKLPVENPLPVPVSPPAPDPVSLSAYAAKRAQFHKVADISYQTPPAPAPKPAPSTWERTLGLKWTAWLGAVVFVIGAGLGMKFAYDQGYFAHVPPWARLVIWSFASFALIGAGEWALRKLSRLASVGLFGAGVASLFLVAYTGFAYYRLYAEGTAFGLMAIAAAVGCVVAARANLVSIAVVALVGAHVSPIVIGGHSGLWRLVTYLVTLQVVALLLAGRNVAARWWTLRGFSLGAAAFWAVALTVRAGHVPSDVVVYAVVTALLAQLELAFSTARGKTAALNAGIGLYSCCATAFPFAVLWFHPHVDELRFLCGAFGGWLVLGVLARLLKKVALRHPDTANSELGGPLCRSLLALEDAYRLQALTLLGLGLQMKFNLDELVWPSAGVGAALAVFAAFRPADPLSRRHYSGYFAPLLTLAPLAALVVRLGDDLAQHVAAVGLLGTAVLPHALPGLALSIAAQVVAFLLARPREDAPPRGLYLFTSAMASVATVFFLAAGTTPLVATLGLVTLAWAWLALVLARPLWSNRLLPTVHAVSALGAATLAWLFLLVVGPRLDQAYTPAAEAFLLNRTAIAGALIALSVFAIPKLIRRFRPESPVSKYLVDGRALLPMGLALALAYVGGCLELDRLVARATGLAHAPVFGVDATLARTLLCADWAALCLAFWLVVTSRKRGLPHLLERSCLVVQPLAMAVLLFVAAATFNGDLHVPALLNLPTLSLLLIAGTATLAAIFTRKLPSNATVGLSAFLVLYLTFGLELYRYCADNHPTFGFPWPVASLMLGTLYSAAAFVGLLLAGHRFLRNWAGARAFAGVGFAGVAVFTVVCLLVGLLAPWALGSVYDGLPFANLQSATAAVIAGALVVPLYFDRSAGKKRFAAVMLVLIAFACSSIDVARVFLAFNRNFGASNSDVAVLAAYSIWWAIFALGLVLSGFRFRAAALRYAGLALFGVTLLKVALVDLSGASYGWRVLSLLGLGAILLVTSLLYAKLAPLFLKDERQPTA